MPAFEGEDVEMDESGPPAPTSAMRKTTTAEAGEDDGSK